MKRLKIRKPFIFTLERMGVNTTEIPKKMINRYIRDIKNLHDKARISWKKSGLHKSIDLNSLSQGFIDGIIYSFVVKLKKECNLD